MGGLWPGPPDMRGRSLNTGPLDAPPASALSPSFPPIFAPHWLGDLRKIGPLPAPCFPDLQGGAGFGCLAACRGVCEEAGRWQVKESQRRAIYWSGQKKIELAGASQGSQPRRDCSQGPCSAPGPSWPVVPPPLLA